MKFGSVPDPGNIDFKLPPDHPDTAGVLKKGKGPMATFVGCAKWNKTDLKNFYPKGTKDELAYYSTQFNSIELNATFYNAPSRSTIENWKEKTPENFKFFPKLPQTISHFKRLIDVGPVVEGFCDLVSGLEEKLGMVFLQMHNNFKPKDFDRVEKFVREFPKVIPLAVEVRNNEWITAPEVAGNFYQLLEEHGVTNVLVDTAGRRDLLHMRMTSPTAFVRYVGANHPTDYKRLDEWIGRIKTWKDLGLQNLYFFIHQNVELESPLLSAYFIKKMNDELGTDLKEPKTLDGK